MINSLIKEFKNLIWPSKKQVINDFCIVIVIALILMALVLLMDNGTIFVFEKIASMFLK